MSCKLLWNNGDLYRFPILDPGPTKTHQPTNPTVTVPISFLFNSYQPDVGASNLEANLRSPRWFSTTDSVVSPEAYQETRQDSTPMVDVALPLSMGLTGTPKWKYMANWGDVTLLIGLLKLITFITRFSTLEILAHRNWEWFPWNLNDLCVLFRFFWTPVAHHLRIWWLMPREWFDSPETIRKDSLKLIFQRD